METVSRQDKLYTRHSETTDTLAAMNDGSRIIDKMDGDKAKFCRNGLQVNVIDYDKIKAKVNINVHKLLSYGIVLFTRRYGKRTNNKYDVSFLLDDYIELTGGTIPDDPEQRRRKRHEMQKRIKSELQLLQAIQIVNDQDKIYQSLSPVSFTRIKNGVVTIEFSQRFAEYLLNQNLTVIPAPLFRIAAWSRSAYAMGIKISEYYYLNRFKKQACRLKVKNLLKVTDLPDYETVLKNGKSWKERIKLPFEKAMNELVIVGVLESWRYEDNKTTERFYIFQDTLIIFNLANQFMENPGGESFGGGGESFGGG